MSDDPLAVALQFGFLAILYLFLLWVARSARKDLVRSQEPVLVDEPDLDDDHGHEQAAGAPDARIKVVAAKGYEPGTTLDVSGGALFGRGAAADVHVEDPYASSAHARIFARNGAMYVEDMGSTNGTYLNSRQLRKPEKLGRGDVIRIGDSEYRYEE